MAILNFQKPDKVFQIHTDDRTGKFEFKPLEPGYGLTIGNALRRVLLSSLEGYAITSLRIDGVDHEFSLLDGILEDVTKIVLNLKQVRFKNQVEGIDREVVKVSFSNKEVLTAGDLQEYISGFQILNPELEILHMEPKTSLNFEFTIDKGRGYVPAEENKRQDVAFGTIFVDSIFTPIKHVKYTIEDFRVEQKTDYDKLIIELETDGSIHPKDALTEAAKILIQHFMLFSDERISIDDDVATQADSYDEESLHMRQLLKSKLIDLDLSVRALNCLKAADVETLGELVGYNKSDLMKFRNFGKKSMTELEKLVDKKGLTFGMDLSNYKLEE
jgi:DNA-directed RNA polymerase subunit alpha